MNLKPQLLQKQKACMTIQLQQMIGLLQLSSLDLICKLESIMEDCVFLEYEEDFDYYSDAFFKAQGGKQYSHHHGIDNYARHETLHENLKRQLSLVSLTPVETIIANILIDGIDDRGYLIITLEEVMSLLPNQSLTTNDVLSVLKSIQTLEPAGIGARTLQECISLQLERADMAETVKRNALYLMGCQQPSEAGCNLEVMAKQTGMSIQEIKEAFKVIKRQNSSPGFFLASEETGMTRIPDVIISKQGGHWQARLNKVVSPVLKINPVYAEMIGNDSNKKNGPLRQLRTRLSEARNFVRGLNNRYDTLLQVAGVIVDKQQAYLRQGEEYMQSLSMSNVAEILGVHESTISRSVQNKFVQTPFGVVPMSYFFPLDVTGQGVSSVALKAIIEKMISEEKPGFPMSDLQIRQCLDASGIKVSRRTVSKYRHEMGLASSRQRKNKMYWDKNIH